MNVSWVVLALIAAPDFAVTDVTVDIGDGTRIENATVVVRNGRIAAVGTDVTVSAEIETIDGTGKVLSPGLIEAYSPLGLVEVEAENSTVDNAVDETITPAFRASEGFNPTSTRIEVAREEGITSAIVTPRGGLVSGSADLVALSGKMTSLSDLSNPPTALFINAGQFGQGAAGGSRAAVWMHLRELFDEARFYRSNRAAVDNGKVLRKLKFNPLQLRAMIPVLERRIPVVMQASRASTIQRAITFAKAQNFRLILANAAEAWSIADAIADAGVAVIVSPQYLERLSFSTLAAREDAATLLRAAGVDVIISTLGSTEGGIRRLRQVAGVAVRAGLSHGDAIRAITLAPAVAYGKDADYGSVEVGKRADLVLWSGDPLELQTVAERVWIEGTPQSLETRQKELARRYLKR